MFESMKPFEMMAREELLRALEMFAKNWLAHDGCWFLAAEECFGIDTAIELDACAWARFAAVEAGVFERSAPRPLWGLSPPCRWQSTAQPDKPSCFQVKTSPGSPSVPALTQGARLSNRIASSSVKCSRRQHCGTFIPFPRQVAGARSTLRPLWSSRV